MPRAIILTSRAHTPQAATLMRTSSGPGEGTGTAASFLIDKNSYNGRTAVSNFPFHLADFKNQISS